MLDAMIREVKASMGIYESDAEDTYGLLAEFPNPNALMHAAETVRERGYSHYDAHSPFPIHGMDDAMGLGESKVGYVALAGGIAGLAIALWLQWWTAAIDYPLNISGMPFFAIEPSVPIAFEVTVLLSAFAAIVGMLAFNGLPRPYNPLFYSDRFSRVTDDGFFISVAASDENFDAEETADMLREIGALHIELIQDDGVADIE